MITCIKRTLRIATLILTLHILPLPAATFYFLDHIGQNFTVTEQLALSSFSTSTGHRSNIYQWSIHRTPYETTAQFSGTEISSLLGKLSAYIIKSPTPASSAELTAFSYPLELDGRLHYPGVVAAKAHEATITLSQNSGELSLTVKHSLTMLNGFSCPLISESTHHLFLKLWHHILTKSTLSSNMVTTLQRKTDVVDIFIGMHPGYGIALLADQANKFAGIAYFVEKEQFIKSAIPDFLLLSANCFNQATTNTTGKMDTAINTYHANTSRARSY